MRLAWKPSSSSSSSSSSRSRLRRCLMLVLQLLVLLLPPLPRPAAALAAVEAAAAAAGAGITGSGGKGAAGGSPAAEPHAGTGGAADTAGRVAAAEPSSSTAAGSATATDGERLSGAALWNTALDSLLEQLAALEALAPPEEEWEGEWEGQAAAGGGPNSAGGMGASGDGAVALGGQQQQQDAGAAAAATAGNTSGSSSGVGGSRRSSSRSSSTGHDDAGHQNDDYDDDDGGWSQQLIRGMADDLLDRMSDLWVAVAADAAAAAPPRPAGAAGGGGGGGGSWWSEAAGLQEFASLLAHLEKHQAAQQQQQQQQQQPLDQQQQEKAEKGTGQPAAAAGDAATTTISAAAAAAAAAGAGSGAGASEANSLGQGVLQSQSPPAAEGLQGRQRRRQLLQGGPSGIGTNYANAFRLVFGNFFDLVGGAGRYLATLAAQANQLLLNLPWIRDLAYLATAPLDNLVNSNVLPLPQSNAQLRALLVTALNAYCTPEVTTPPALVLGAYKGPSLSLAVTPAVCPVQVDLETGKRSIQWDACTPARLTVTLTPATYTGKYYTAGRHAGKSCRYSRAFGTDLTLRLGGGTTATTLRTSARQLDIVPVLNQFFFRGLFSAFVADNLAIRNITGGPVLQASSVAAPAPAAGSNGAIVFRTPAAAAAAAAAAAGADGAGASSGGGGDAAGGRGVLQEDVPTVYRAD